MITCYLKYGKDQIPVTLLQSGPKTLVKRRNEMKKKSQNYLIGLLEESREKTDINVLK